jgi:copper(I)-binding protein
MRNIFIAAALLCLPSLAEAASPPAIAASNAWARASIGASTMGAAYLTLTDNGAPDSLTGVTTPVAASASLHQTTTEGGIKRMRPVPVLPLAPGKSVTFAPGGYHIMLMGLTHKLKAGEQFPLTLTFTHAPPVTVQVQVTPVGAPAPSAMPDMPDMHM